MKAWSRAVARPFMKSGLKVQATAASASALRSVASERFTDADTSAIVAQRRSHSLPKLVDTVGRPAP